MRKLSHEPSTRLPPIARKIYLHLTRLIKASSRPESCSLTARRSGETPVFLRHSESTRTSVPVKTPAFRLYLPALLLLTAAIQAQDPTENYNPIADPSAQVTLGNARFTVLTPQMIRMEWAAGAHFEDRASFVFLNRRLPVPPFTKNITRTAASRVLHLHTASLDLTYTLSPHNSGNSDGHFTPTNLAVSLTLNGKPVTWTPGLTDPENLLGTTRTLDGARGGKTQEPIGQGLISRSGWAIVDDSTTPLFDSADFSFPRGEDSPLPWVAERPEITNQTETQYDQLKQSESPTTTDPATPILRQDWYLIAYGHDYKQALFDYVRVAGRIPLPPRFAFGAWWSRYWSYSDQELDDLVHQARANNVPLDVLVIDMDWHLPFGNDWSVKDPSGNQARWTGYTWNKLLFPDPQLFLDKMHREGLKVTLNLHPASGVQPFEEPYPAMARAMGIDPASNNYIPFDITDKKFARNYLDLLHHPLEHQGIDFWWLDWQQSTHTKLPGVNPTWWLNYVHFTDQQREGKRPLLFHRWGGLGNHRYQIGFSGDVISTWDSLAFQPWFTATAANVGYAYWSHDIGGHMPGKIDPELYTRWLQFGALSPILRTHTTKNPDAERRIWAYPEPYSDVMRQAYTLRYALLPYLYTEARRTYDTGVAFLRPLYYNWPESPEAYTSKNEYQLGENLLVAPIATPADPETNLAHQTIWLPPGEWIESPTGRHFTGPLKLDRSFSLPQTPLYLRAGAIVPLAPPMLYTNQHPLSPLIVEINPLANNATSQYTLYEDSGDSPNYTTNESARTTLSATQSADTLTVTVAPAQGTYPGMPTSRSYQLKLPDDWPPTQVTVNDISIPYQPDAAKPGWHFEGNTLTTIVTTGDLPITSAVTFRIQRDPTLTARRAELDGFSGTIQRLREAYDALQNNTPVDTPPDELTDAMQTGDRLSYHPEQASAILTHFYELLPKVAAAVAKTESVDDQRRETMVHNLMTGNHSYTPEAATAMLTQIRRRDSIATAAIADIQADGQKQRPAAAPTGNSQ
ncbi:glycoside hydrolase family 31 protein [Tunturiibacter empetritectus]|uniref:Alpha-glucosidase n=1 Tax=Tunturiibacter lichenicola TaxID=2051959 RepID=A0A852VCZ4_9BACT|nr:TIM-barrel domain-containing protein [Edaphobacter lichenicola]NYF88729.1 alpha-glucosidase [Edaphobacter lichenicola]